MPEITKQAAVPGTVVGSGSLITPGGAQGPAGPTAVSTDSGNIATLGSDSLILVPRSFNAIGNPNFEVDQPNVGGAGPGISNYSVDRWLTNFSSTLGAFATQQLSANIVVPGTNFLITQNYLHFYTAAVVASLPAAAYLYHTQTVEGPQLRELINGVHSIQLLVRSSVAGLKFGAALESLDGLKSLTKLCTIPSANTWTLITLPNLPVWPVGNFSLSPGNAGYSFIITLAAGTTYTASANNTWQNAGVFGAVGQDNFFSKPSGSTFDLAFVQHEPGSQCTTLIDKPFSQNLDECFRYFCKSYNYGTLPGAAVPDGCATCTAPPSGSAAGTFRFPKPMAKAPTINGYSTSGVQGNVRDNLSSVDRAITGFFQPVSAGGFSGFTIATTNASVANYSFQYAAYTGW